MVSKNYVTVRALDIENEIKYTFGINLDVSQTLFGDYYYNDTFQSLSLDGCSEEDDENVKIVYSFLRKQFPFEKEILIDTSW